MDNFFLADLGHIGVIWLVAEWALRLGALFIVPRNRKPSSAMAWLLVIFFIPFIGVPLYLILSNPKLPKSRRNAQKTLDGFIANTLAQFKKERDPDHILEADVPEKYKPLAKLSESLTHFPAFGGNHVTVLPEYNEVVESMITDVKKAQHYIHVEFFIIKIDELTEPLFDALRDAVGRGVRVRMMYDALSTRRLKGLKAMVQRLEKDGILVQAMLPLRIGKGYIRPDLRNHRKLLVVDGKIGYTGSLNLIRRDYHRKDDIYYDELVVRATGPIALQLSAVFMTDWYSETSTLLNYKDLGTIPSAIENHGSSVAQILPSGPGYDDENNLKVFTNLIHMAQKRIFIANPYFVPDDALMNAITSAAKRGVEVTMVNSEAMDQWMVGHAQRSFYEGLLQAGVNIYLYKAPVLLHSKFIIVDGEVATVGSSNLDIRSFELDLEVTLICYDPKVVRSLDKVATTYLTRSKKITLKKWVKRSRRKVLLDNIARLTSAIQ